MQTRLLLLAPIIAGMTVVAVGQSSEPSFDVVSIKRNVSGREDIGINLPNAATFSTTNLAMLGILKRAYQVKNVAGAPDWIEAERYDISAKAAGKPTSDEMNAMLRTMLKERLRLAARIEPREIPVYALVVARRDHPGLKAFTRDCVAIQAEREAAMKAGQSPPTTPNAAPACGYTWSEAIYSGGITMATFAGMLDYVAGRVVVDRTGLPGRYEFTLRFAPPGQVVTAGRDDAPDFFSAIRDQLGLRLEATRAPVDTLVIDYVERPSDN